MSARANYLAIRQFRGPGVTFKVSLPCNLTAIEILNTLHSTVLDTALKVYVESSRLALQTPRFRKILADTDVPVPQYPQLILNDPAIPYTPLKYVLVLVPEEFSERVGLFVKIADPNFENAFVYDLEIYPNEVVLDKLKDTFPHHQDLLIDDQLASGTETALSVLGKEIILKCLFDSDTLAKLNNRKKKIEETIATEKNYVTRLAILKDFWRPKLKNSEFFTPDEISSIFAGIETLYNVHSSFYESISSNPIDSASCFGYHFLNYCQFFKNAQIFINKYNANDKMIQKKMQDNPRCNDFMMQLASDQSKSINGTINSFLITVVQRFAQYCMLLQDLEKLTPTWHQDYDFISKAKIRIKDLTQNINDRTAKAELIDVAPSLYFQMDQAIDIVSPTRYWIEKFDCLYSNSQQKALIYVFNDLILAVLVYARHQKPLFSVSPDVFKYISSSGSSKGVNVLTNSGKSYLIVFETVQNVRKCLKCIEKVRYSFISTQYPVKTGFYWRDIVSMTDPPAISDHSSVCLGDRIYFLGFQRESLLYTFDFRMKTISSVKANIPMRSGYLMMVHGDKILVHGGNHGNMFYGDLWEYSPLTNEWTILDNTGVPRSNHVGDIYNGKLIVYGGRNNEKTLSDVSVFDFAHSQWTIVEQDLYAGPRESSACAKHKDRLYVFGGILNGVPSADMCVMDMNTGLWISMREMKSNSQLVPRSGHRLLTVNDRIVIIGGENNESFVNTCVVDLTHWTAITAQEFGNLPGYLSRFAATSVEDRKIIILGGRQQPNSRPHASIRTVSIPSIDSRVFESLLDASTNSVCVSTLNTFSFHHESPNYAVSEESVRDIGQMSSDSPEPEEYLNDKFHLQDSRADSLIQIDSDNDPETDQILPQSEKEQDIEFSSDTTQNTSVIDVFSEAEPSASASTVTLQPSITEEDVFDEKSLAKELGIDLDQHTKTEREKLSTELQSLWKRAKISQNIENRPIFLKIRDGDTDSIRILPTHIDITYSTLKQLIKDTLGREPPFISVFLFDTTKVLDPDSLEESKLLIKQRKTSRISVIAAD